MQLVSAPVTVRVVEPEEMTPYIGGEDSPVDDALLTMLLAAAVDKVESLTGRALITRQFTETRHPCDWIRRVPLMRAPVTAFTSLTVDGELVDAEDYELIANEVRPDPYIFCDRSLVLVYSAGYSLDPNEIPAALRLAVLRTAATWYEMRETAVVGTITAEMPPSVNGVISQYRRHLL